MHVCWHRATRYHHDHDHDYDGDYDGDDDDGDQNVIKSIRFYEEEYNHEEYDFEEEEKRRVV